MVVSQIDNLTSGPSFGYSLCVKCPNESCKPILDIYVPRAFQWYKELLNPLNFDPYNCPLTIEDSAMTPTPKVKAPLGVWGFIPSHFPHTPKSMWHDSWASLFAHNLASPYLGREPKARVATKWFHLLYYTQHVSILNIIFLSTINDNYWRTWCAS
jgi:hypothetical protein